MLLWASTKIDGLMTADAQKATDPNLKTENLPESCGRGFTGVMRRWNFSGFRATHGTHEYFRHGGILPYVLRQLLAA